MPGAAIAIATAFYAKLESTIINIFGRYDDPNYHPLTNDDIPALLEYLHTIQDRLIDEMALLLDSRITNNNASKLVKNNADILCVIQFILNEIKKSKKANNSMPDRISMKIPYIAWILVYGFTNVAKENILPSGKGLKEPKGLPLCHAALSGDTSGLPYSEPVKARINAYMRNIWEEPVPNVPFAVKGGTRKRYRSKGRKSKGRKSKLRKSAN